MPELPAQFNPGPRHLSRTTYFGECLTCGEGVTEKCTQWFHDHGKEEVILGVTHPTCAEPNDLTLNERCNEECT